jgi:mono/diheme cytochrome c family protein
MIRSSHDEYHEVIMMRIGLFSAAVALCSTVAAAGELSGPQIVFPLPDAERGRFLFSSKGCVVCHSINGVGGKAGPALDTSTGKEAIEPLEFAARMWRGAAAMSMLQSMEFGYQIEMTGEEIADLAAFVASPALQRTFSDRDIPEMMQGWTIDEPFPEKGGEWFDGRRGDDLALSGNGKIADVARGHMLTERWCTSCHVVVPDGEGGAAGPAFASIASRPDATEESILNWLSVPHPTMPEFMNLVETDFNDIAAYIMSLEP